MIGYVKVDMMLTLGLKFHINLLLSVLIQFNVEVLQKHLTKLFAVESLAVKKEAIACLVLLSTISQLVLQKTD